LSVRSFTIQLLYFNFCYLKKKTRNKKEKKLKTKINTVFFWLFF
jgi:hypothetical protein